MTLTYTLKYKIGANLLAIGGNVAELHHRSENLLYRRGACLSTSRVPTCPKNLYDLPLVFLQCVTSMTGAQPGIFEARGGFLEYGQFDKYFIYNS